MKESQIKIMIDLISVLRGDCLELFDDHKKKTSDLANKIEKQNIQDVEGKNKIIKEMGRVIEVDQIIHSQITELQVDLDKKLEDLISELKEHYNL